MDCTKWPAKWQRGLLDFLILAVISAEGGPTYGYRIVQDLEERGFGRTTGGTLYPILARLEQEGLVVSSWGEGASGPGRKFIQITLKGEAHLAHLGEQWEVFSRAITALSRHPWPRAHIEREERDESGCTCVLADVAQQTN